MAILKRGKAQSIKQKLKESLWPTMGWSRTADYYRHRVFRGGDSASRVAAGLAVGAAVSFTPLLGFHFFQALFFAFLARVSLVAAFVGTAVGNPWTFPFLFWVAYKTGVFVCTVVGAEEFVRMPSDISVIGDPQAFLQYALQNPAKLAVPLTLGGYVCALVSWPVFYALFYYPVLWMRRAYQKQRFRFEAGTALRRCTEKNA